MFIKSGLIFSAAISITGFTNVGTTAYLDGYSSKAEKFVEYRPGNSNSFHIYYPGDVVEYNGQEYKNIKAMNNSHSPADPEVEGSFWQKVEIQNINS